MAKTIVILSVIALNSAILASCLPNIRIQVNNENLQSPPYVLQAIKDAEAIQNHPPAQPQASEESQPKAEALEVNVDNGSDASAAVSAGNFSVIKEETIEEILDLEPDSIIKMPSGGDQLMSALSPVESQLGNSGDSMSAAESSNVEDTTRLKSDRESVSLSMPANQRNHEANKLMPQTLPVTNSHLKKPASSLMNDNLESNLPPSDVPNHQSGGAKSFVAPTVSQDEALPANSEQGLVKKTIPLDLPDTLEPSQVMNGVTNASLVPATVTREYGYQKRTRVTLGGGYVRDKTPAMEPQAPAEKPQLISSSSSSSGNFDKEYQAQDSKVIQVPERIIVPETVFTKPQQQQLNKRLPQQTNATSPTKRQDNRCPRSGVMSFEHPKACEKYYLCEDGFISEHSCPNGLLYGTRDMITDYCVHRWKVVCGEKSIPNPISSPGCRWQYGIFNVQGSPRCSPDFYECTEGVFQVRKCSVEGQIYDDRTKSCQFAEAVGCQQEALSEFKCPPDDQANTYWPFPRYFLNERSLIHCINDKPEIVRCTENERVDPEHLHCVPIAKKTTDESETLSARRSREKNKKQPGGSSTNSETPSSQ